MRHIVPCIETHTCGEPTRFISVFNLPGDTMAAKQDYCRRHLDHLRRGLLHEPRGHRHMFGAILTNPVTPGATLGVIWADSGGYLSGCGHATIALGVALIETGMVPVVEPVTELKIDVPSGPLHLKVRVEGGRARETSFCNVPAFSVASNVSVDVPGIGRIVVDIAFGGNFFAILEARQVGLAVTRETTGRLAEIGLAIRDAVNSQHQVCHPVLSHLNKVELVTFLGPASRRDARYLNTHMFGKGSIDRSPGGTATSAMLAVLHAKGEIMVGDVVTAEGVAGGFFRGRVVERTRVGDRDAVVPEVTGPAAVTGLHHFVVDSDDALSAGFELA